MTSKKHRMIVYGVAVHLLLVAIVCYAAFPVEASKEPLRIMYQTKAGKVLFDHQTHTGAEGFGLECADCHHHAPDEHGVPGEEGEEGSLLGCKKCHLPNQEEGVIPESCLECHDEGDVEDSEYDKSSVAIHDQCTNCHKEYGRGPLYNNSLTQEEQESLKATGWVDCNKCHVI